MKNYNYSVLTKNKKDEIVDFYKINHNIVLTCKNFKISRISFIKIINEDCYKQQVILPNHKKNKILSKEDFGIKDDELQFDLKKYVSIFNNKSMKAAILKQYKSIEDYVSIMYWLKFVKKYTYAEMEEKFNFHNADNKYYDSKLNWHYNTNNFNECEKLYQKDLIRLKKIYEDSLKDTSFFFDQDYRDYYTNAMKKKFTASLSIFKTKGQFVDSLWYMYKIKKLSPKEISIAINSTVASVRSACRRFGINFGIVESQKLSYKLRERDYSKSLQRARNTRYRKESNSFLSGSILENACRTYIDTNISKYINIDENEIIVGINSLNIIKRKEVDIPVIIINKKNEKIFKYAIEIDGNNWHNERQKEDKEKEELLKGNNWKTYRIVQEYGENTKYVIEKIDDVLKDIAKFEKKQLVFQNNN